MLLISLIQGVMVQSAEGPNESGFFKFSIKCDWCLAVEMCHHNARALRVVFRALLKSFYGVLNHFWNVAN